MTVSSVAGCLVMLVTFVSIIVMTMVVAMVMVLIIIVTIIDMGAHFRAF